MYSQWTIQTYNQPKINTTYNTGPCHNKYNLADERGTGERGGGLWALTAVLGVARKVHDPIRAVRQPQRLVDPRRDRVDWQAS